MKTIDKISVEISNKVFRELVDRLEYVDEDYNCVAFTSSYENYVLDFFASEYNDVPFKVETRQSYLEQGDNYLDINFSEKQIEELQKIADNKFKEIEEEEEMRREEELQLESEYESDTYSMYGVSQAMFI
ncbi:hypothetical protein [Joostella sp. CR20]|uniref:hypothetical protein n=1 Tax=Joostella sp. CR20 TaxID=2804312 RepID=UPI00313DA34F